MECLKFDEKKVDLKKSAVWNVWKQFDIDIEELEEKIDVTEHYMPQEEQDKLMAFMRKNYRKLKTYFRRKKVFEHSLSYEVLAYFPSGIRNHKTKLNDEVENEN